MLRGDRPARPVAAQILRLYPSCPEKSEQGDRQFCSLSSLYYKSVCFS